MAAGRKKKADEGLVLALACGATPEGAAHKTGLSLRTVYRRLAQSAFRQRIDQARAEMVRRAAGLFTAAGMAAFKTFTSLQESASSEAVRLGAARAIIELGCKLRQAVEINERIAAVEARLEALCAGGESDDIGQAPAGQGISSGERNDDSISPSPPGSVPEPPYCRAES
jgi:hypothetical protein